MHDSNRYGQGACAPGDVAGKIVFSGFWRLQAVNLTQAMEASELLIRHWRGGMTLEVLPFPLRPQTRAEGYLIQSQIDSLSTK